MPIPALTEGSEIVTTRKKVIDILPNLTLLDEIPVNNQGVNEIEKLLTRPSTSYGRKPSSPSTIQNEQYQRPSSSLGMRSFKEIENPSSVLTPGIIDNE